MALGTCDGLIPSVGTKLYLSATAPATYDEAGWDALSWTEVYGVENINPFGAQTQVNELVPLSTGVACKTKGPTDYGQLEWDMGKHTTDDGQVALATARAAAGPYSFKVELAETGIVENHRYYMRALVTEQRVTPGDPSTSVMEHIVCPISGVTYEYALADA